MHKTLLLCFIHGFKGGDDTFGKFPEDLRALIALALPNITVKVITYPKYDTRGDLKECVSAFRKWLVNEVIDLEVKAAYPSPTVDPSVHTILIGHSMGGIVAAETLLSISADFPISPTTQPTTTTSSHPSEPLPSTAAHTDPTTTNTPEPSALLFPYISGILAFDTPFLGIAPSVVAYGAESHYQSASSAYSAFTAATSFFGSKSASSSAKPSTPTSPIPQSPQQALPPPTTADTSDAAAVPAWQRWGKVAMFAGAAGAVAAGGAAAYIKRDKIGEGWGWLGSHLEFVGCLARPEELRSRLERVAELCQRRGIGLRDLVTVLGKGKDRGSRKEVQPARFGPGGIVEVGGEGRGNGKEGERERTFCSVPVREGMGALFEKSVNDFAKDETEAHMTMFERKGNSHYYGLRERAKTLVTDWVEGGEWYRSSEPDPHSADPKHPNQSPSPSPSEQGAGSYMGRGESGAGPEAGAGEGRKSFGGLIDVDLNDEDDKNQKGEKEWVTGEEPVWVNKYDR